MKCIKYSVYTILGIIGLFVAFNFLDNLEFHDRLVLSLLGFIAIITALHYKQTSKEPKYACFFSKKIIDPDSQEVLAELQQNFYLPMRPFPGLSISEPWTDTILSVSCDTECQRFYCTTEPREIKKTDNLGKILAGYYEHTRWQLWNLNDEPEKLLKQYIEEEEKRLAEGDQTRFSLRDDQYRLDKIKRKLEAALTGDENHA